VRINNSSGIQSSPVRRLRQCGEAREQAPSLKYRR
jgi:hypothetical protein